MKLLLIVVTGFIFVTYAWGWIGNVYKGNMDTKGYTQYYWRQANEKFYESFHKVKQAYDWAKKPLPVAPEKQL